MDRGQHLKIDTGMVTKGILAKFMFKGGRNYVHGTDIYSTALSVARELLGHYPEEVTGTFHRILKNQGIFRLCKDERGTSSGDIYSRFVFRIGESKYELVLNATDQPISHNRPYDERDVLCNSEMSSGSIHMAVRSDYTYIEQIVAMTKRLHEVIYEEVNDKWFFTRFHIKRCIDPKAFYDRLIEVRIGRKLQNILSQCSIFVNDSPVGNIFFTAVREGDNRQS